MTRRWVPRGSCSAVPIGGLLRALWEPSPPVVPGPPSMASSLQSWPVAICMLRVAGPGGRGWLWADPHSATTGAVSPLHGPGLGVRAPSRAVMCPGQRLALDGQWAGCLPPGRGCASRTRARADQTEVCNAVLTEVVTKTAMSNVLGFVLKGRWAASARPAPRLAQEAQGRAPVRRLVSWTPAPRTGTARVCCCCSRGRAIS